MSRRCTMFLAVMVLVTSAAFASDAPALTREQQEVWKVSQAWLSAYNHRDLDAFARFTADDFIGATDDGIFMTKTRLINRISTHPPEADQRTGVGFASLRNSYWPAKG